MSMSMTASAWKCVPGLHPVLAAAALTMMVVAITASAQAQLRSLKPEVTATVPEAQTFHPGGKGTVTLHVKLPDTVHVQSDKPLDKSLIATALSIEAPPGVRVERIAYPAATTLKQEGQKQPLMVFRHEFTITVHLALTPVVASGEIRVPARLRYQACDETMCYPPARVETLWTLRIEG
jgi:DsbC/DsbD-like thiol-disulfide interchange protein